MVYTKLNIIQNASETKYLENDQGYISKTIVDSNAENGEVTVEVKVSNTSKETSEKVNYDSTEIVFVVDNSWSMNEKVNETQTRRDVVISAAKEFSSSLFKEVSNLKIGLLYYYAYDDGTDGAIQDYGTVNTAKIISNLTGNETEIQVALTSLSTMDYNSGTNTDAGLQKARTMFSEGENIQKFIILLSDGVPNHAVGEKTQWYQYEDASRNNRVISKTKETIQKIDENKINFITMLAGLKDLTESDTNTITNIFGTTTNPTVGSLYNIADTDIAEVIKNEIYTDVLEKVQNPLNTVKVVDYFPTDITENFEFTYVEKPSMGEVSNTIDEKTNSITWDIGTLKGNEVATLKYKLKIKDMSKQSPVYNKELATNEKILLTYKDREEKDYEVTLASSPKIKLVEVEESQTSGITENPTEDGKEKQVGDSAQKDTTVANGILPNTGVSFIIIIAIMGVCIMAIVGLKGYRDNRDIK